MDLHVWEERIGDRQYIQYLIYVSIVLRMEVIHSFSSHMAMNGHIVVMRYKYPT
jgi:hypothetical protein